MTLHSCKLSARDVLQNARKIQFMLQISHYNGLFAKFEKFVKFGFAINPFHIATYYLPISTTPFLLQNYSLIIVFQVIYAHNIETLNVLLF